MVYCATARPPTTVAGIVGNPLPHFCASGVGSTVGSGVGEGVAEAVGEGVAPGIFWAVDCAPQPASAVILVSVARIRKHRIDRKDMLANAFSCHLEQMIIPYQ